MANPKLRTAAVRDFFKQYDETQRLVREVSDNIDVLDIGNTMLETLDSKRGQDVFDSALVYALKADHVLDLLRDTIRGVVEEVVKEALAGDALKEFLEDVIRSTLKKDLVTGPEGDTPAPQKAA